MKSSFEEGEILDYYLLCSMVSLDCTVLQAGCSLVFRPEAHCTRPSEEEIHAVLYL